MLLAARGAGLGVKVHAEQRSHSGGRPARRRAGRGQRRPPRARHRRRLPRPGRRRGDRRHPARGRAGARRPRPPGRRLLDAGATVAIATDCNPGSCYSESMPLMVSLAVATAGLTPAQALVAATAGGAAALRLARPGGAPRRAALRRGHSRHRPLDRRRLPPRGQPGGDGDPGRDGWWRVASRRSCRSERACRPARRRVVA